ncbi:MAG: N-6 DNA methylase [Bacteroidales bacterium]|jgi:REP element-mobilizing transposase RayT/tRNA1(Val) A37 N6-methylase TrmN6|nr:N-6 DNA methylase [Bacteroidales bacterium]
MSLFQQKILKKQITANIEKINYAYKLYADYFHNPTIQENIRNSKEEQFQEGFLWELFVKVLGYMLNPAPNYNLITEKKNETNSRKADGAILVNGDVRAIIELKDSKTTDLKTVESQAFGYKNYNRNAVYVVTSNFEKLRFYIDTAVEHIEFNLFTLTADEFAVLWLCLAYENISKDLPKSLKNESVSNEDQITKELYKDYSRFKRELFANLTEQNPQYDKLLLFKKSQKLLDRLLFIFFAEDRSLLPPNSIAEIINQWEKLKELDEYRPLYERFQKYFGYMNTGFKGKKHDIFAYNGGLFKPDEILDNIFISDEVLQENSLRLSQYDFGSEVDVNILGHIFENSLTEIEEISSALSSTMGHAPLAIKNASLAIENAPLAVEKSKRKKDGVFYTPRHITTYIVENTLGKLCAEKKAELEIDESEYFADKKRQLATKKKLDEKLTAYRQWLLRLTICDPACGSGAFLNAALDFLIAEHNLLDEMSAKLLGGGLVFPDVENAILENNLYGVDINEESVEIAKLALWLRTAKPNRKLNSLNDNIKCGNSLISDPEVAGDKAFDWQKEFPQVFKEKEKKAFHITTAIHDSRTSQRMIDYKVRQKRYNGTLPEPQVYPLSDNDEQIITETIAKIVKEDGLNVMAYNICVDHLHLLLVCEEEEVPKIVGKIKSMTARACNIARGVTIPYNNGACPIVKEKETACRPLVEEKRGETQVPLWTQKFGCKEITSDEQLWNTVEYIRNNRVKHGLADSDADTTNKRACSLVKEIAEIETDFEHAFRTEYKGGFDVVIGNPPYGAKIDNKQISFLTKRFANWGITNSMNDTYFVFYAISLECILKQNGVLGFITPNTWRLIEGAKDFRKKISDGEFQLLQIIQHANKVFADATVDCDTLIVQKQNRAENNISILFLNNSNIDNKHILPQLTLTKQDYYNLFLTEEDYALKDKILKQSELVKDEFIIKNGVKPYEKGKGKPAQTSVTMQEKPFTSEIKKDDSFSPLIGGSYFHRYKLLWNHDYWIQYGEWLAAPRDKFIFEAEEKLIFRQTSDCLIGALVTKGFIMRDNTHILLNKEDSDYNLKYALSILNSKLLNYFYWTINPEKGEVMAQVKAFHLGLLPIKQIPLSAQQPFIEKADLMLSLNAELQTKRQRFISRLKDNFENIKITGALEKFDESDFKGFVAELKKQKITLSLKQQDEWEEYFSEYKTECNQLSSQIAETVYELYGLTEEEVKIIEKT